MDESRGPQPFVPHVPGTPDTAPTPRGARQSTLRELNLGLVVRQVFAEPGVLTRADVAAVTGMTRSTVSRLVDQLLAGGVLAEGDPESRSGRGRPGVPLRPASETFVSLGIEANVGHLATYALDLAGTHLASEVQLTELAGSDPADALAALARQATAVLDRLDARPRLLSVHLAVPGIVDHDTGLLLRAPNLRWPVVDPRALLRAAGLDIGRAPFGVGNEADYAALTIVQTAPGRTGDLDAFLYVSGNVGIGSASVMRGQVMAGRHGWAGELGHVCVDPDGPRCGCGATGCLEAVAGRRAMLAASGLDDWDAFLRAAEQPDPALAAVLDRVAHALGVALAGALNLLDLSHIVLGGHLAGLAPRLLPVVEEELGVRVLSAPWAQVRITTADTRAAPGALGAAYRGINELLEHPVRALTGPGEDADG